MTLKNPVFCKTKINKKQKDKNIKTLKNILMSVSLFLKIKYTQKIYNKPIKPHARVLNNRVFARTNSFSEDNIDRALNSAEKIANKKKTSKTIRFFLSSFSSLVFTFIFFRLRSVILFIPFDFTIYNKALSRMFLIIL